MNLRGFGSGGLFGGEEGDGEGCGLHFIHGNGSIWSLGCGWFHQKRTGNGDGNGPRMVVSRYVHTYSALLVQKQG